MPESYAPATRLRDLFDAHGALLAEFDFFPEQEILRVRWHGHLTAASVIAGVKAGMKLRRDGTVPRRILDDKSDTSGDWSEAIPWIQYEWLPPATAGGLQVIAYVLSPNPTSQAVGYSFAKAVQWLLPLQVFQNPTEAWQWLLRHGSTT